MDTEHRPDREQSQEEYAFIQEVIKDDKSNKKWTSQIGRWASIGLIFGIFACIGFFALKPFVGNIFRDNPNKVEIPKDDAEEGIENSGESSHQGENITIENYRELSGKMAEVAIEAEKSIVQVKGIAQGDNWLTSEQEFSYQATGLIVADNGPELLILVEYSKVKDAGLFRIKFADGTEHESVIKQKDGNSDLAIFSVAKSGIKEKSWEKIKVATLGNSIAFERGNLLIALGHPFGFDEGIGYGVASSVDEKILLADGEYDILITDMPRVESGDGFLFDSYGNVIGVIQTDLIKEAKTLTAIGISAVKNEIELMSNGKNVSYVGIIGTMVTKEMSEVRGIPEGLYVSEVEVDSPAMKAGIQSGDIITQIDDKEIKKLSEYHTAIVGQEAGKTIKFVGLRYGSESYVDIKFNVTVGVKQ